MSEFHPSRPPIVKTRGRLRMRKLVEGWPLLVWLGVGGIAVGMHTKGTSFVRMNGAVDVNHQYVTPVEDGKVVRILVEQGQRVEPGTVVAEMDSGALRHQLNALLLGVSATRREEVLRLDRIRIDLEAELRESAVAVAEGNGRLGPLQRFLTKSQQPAAKPVTTGTPGSIAAAFGRPTLFAADALALESEIGEITSRVEVVQKNIMAIEKELKHVAASIEKITEDSATAQRAGKEETSAELLAALSETERAELLEIKNLIAACQLRAGKGGTIDRVDRNEGEFVRAGESILQVVAETGRIVGFLPQAQLGKLQEGDKVWVSPAHDRTVVYATSVKNISTRVSSVLDGASPLPNQRIYGRNITVLLPQSTDGTPLRLVPGQSVTIHTAPPGEIPLINRIFKTDPPVL